MSLKIFQTDFFHFLNAFRRINTILMMLVFTFFNADVMKFHVAAILRIKMLETIQKKWNAFKWITLLRKFSSGKETFYFPNDVHVQSKYREKLFLTLSFFKNLNSNVWERFVSKRKMENQSRGINGFKQDKQVRLINAFRSNHTKNKSSIFDWKLLKSYSIFFNFKST